MQIRTGQSAWLQKDHRGAVGRRGHWGLSQRHGVQEALRRVGVLRMKV